jgi:hypothetical protein
VLARKTRVKKKLEFQDLRDQVDELKLENVKLKELILKAFPDPVAAKEVFGIDVHELLKVNTIRYHF